MCGVPRSASAITRARNPPIARGDRRSVRRCDAPNPGRSTANKRARSASAPHIGANAYTLSGHGLVSSSVGPDDRPLSAYRILSPSRVPKSGLNDVVAELLTATPFVSRRLRSEPERGCGRGSEDEVRAEVL